MYTGKKLWVQKGGLGGSTQIGLIQIGLIIIGQG